MKGRIMSDHNPNDRVYVRVPKPLDEMTPEEIHEFAEDTGKRPAVFYTYIPAVFYTYI